MPANTVALLDLAALVVVLAGTFLATIARCGWGDMRAAASALLQLGQSTFDEDANRAALARSAPEIRRRGHLIADPAPPPDACMAKLVDIYRKTGSIDAVHAAARGDRAIREVARIQAVRVFDYAGELAPIFGLVGTLFAITQLTPTAGASSTETMMGAVATAVLSSLYGVLTAHLFCAPIAGAIERRGQREEAARAQLIEWFDAEVAGDRSRAPSTIRDAA